MREPLEFWRFHYQRLFRDFGSFVVRNELVVFYALGGTYRAVVKDFSFNSGIGSLEVVTDEGLDERVELISFHSIVIEDGSRSVDVGEPVFVTLVPGLFGQLDAKRIVKLSHSDVGNIKKCV